MLVALLVHLGAAAMFSTFIIGGSDETMRVRAIHRAALGQPIPEGFGDGVVLWFVGRHVVFLSNQTEDMLYLLYYEGAVAGTTPPDEFKQNALTLLDEIEIPWKRAGQSKGQVHGQQVEVDCLEIQFQPNATSHGYLSAFSTPDGRTVCLFFMGQEKPAMALAKEIFSRGF